ncbi:hypothetical protein AAG906_001815 [Vitis piasezkii]
MKQGKVKEKKNDNGGEDDQVATTTSDFLIVYDSDVVNFACQETSWVIDSGASIHATPRKDFFTSYTSGDFGSVRMGNDGSAKAIGMGDVRLETSNGTMLTLKNLDDEGFCNTFRDSRWKLTRGSMVIAKGNKTRVAFKTLRHTRKPIWVYTLKTKDQVLDVFKRFHALVERQSYSGPFDEYCRQHGIRHQKTPPKTPQFDVRIEFGQIMKSLMITCVSLDARLLCIFPKMRDLSLMLRQDLLGYCFMIRSEKLVRSRDVVFMEDHTIQDIEKTNPMESQDSSDLIDLDPAPLTNLPTQMKHMMTNMTWVMLKHPHRLRWMMMFMSSHQQQRLHQIFHLEEHESYVEAMKDENKMKWVDAMRDEMEVKQEEHTSQPRYKARLVVKGFNQKKGIDFDEIFSPVVKMSSIRVVLGLAASLDLEIQQMDVKTAFLHGDLDKEIYMEQPEGFVLKGKEDYVCKLKKSLYGLKQAPRQWYKKFESVMGEQGYRKTTSDHCVFVQKFSDDDFVILLLYVDDILIVGRNVSRIDNLKKQASKKLCMLQEQYIEKVLARFNMSKAKVVSSPLASHFKLSSRHSPSTDKEKEDMRRLVLLVGFIESRRHHWEAIKWIMRYLRDTSKLKLTFGNGNQYLLDTPIRHGGDVLVSWQSRLRNVLHFLQQRRVHCSEACKELLWMKCFIQELGFKQRYVVSCDNQSAIHLKKNSTYHARSKHIDVRYHWMRDALNDNLFEIEKIHLITMARIC